MFKQHPKVWSAVREYGIITVATLIMVIGIFVLAIAQKKATE